MTVINITAPMLAFQMQRSLHACRAAMTRRTNPSAAMIGLMDFYNTNAEALKPFASDVLDQVIDLALHPHAVTGTRDEVVWHSNSGYVTAATLHRHDYVIGDGDQECKLASRFAACMVDRLARDNPEAIDEHHVSGLLEVTRHIEGGQLPAEPEMPLHKTLVHLARNQPDAFTEGHIEEIGRRHRDLFAHGRAVAETAASYKTALMLLLLRDEPPTPEPPGANIVRFARPGPK